LAAQKMKGRAPPEAASLRLPQIAQRENLMSVALTCLLGGGFGDFGNRITKHVASTPHSFDIMFAVC